MATLYLKILADESAAVSLRHRLHKCTKALCVSITSAKAYAVYMNNRLSIGTLVSLGNLTYNLI